MSEQAQVNSSAENETDGNGVSARVFSPAAHNAGRRIDRLLAEYGESHQNIINKLIHWLAVPVITWCVLALLWVTPFPAAFEIVGGLNWAWILTGLAILYYLTLSLPLAIGMAGFAAACLSLVVAYLNWGDLPLWQFAIALFVVAWLFQLLGHKIEGRRPSFFKDIQFLLIGPAWLMSFIFRLLRIRY